MTWVARHPNRKASPARHGLTAALAAAWLALAGCAGTPPTRWYELRLDAPVSAAVRAPAGPVAEVDEVWELSPRVPLPGALDRDTLGVASGDAQWQPLAGHRWVEPLRDSVPRVLLHDLSLLRGAGRVWAAPAPGGVSVSHRLRVEILVLQADAQRGLVRLSARWWLADARTPVQAAGAPVAPPQAGQADFTVAVAGPSVDALAAAHRQALWTLAERIAR